MVDTNVLVSRLLSPRGAPSQVFDHWERESFELLVSQPILAEYQRALSYEHVAARHGMNVEEVGELIDQLQRLATLVEPAEVSGVIAEDPADEKFLACAVAGGADCIISGDRHLLNLQEYQGIPILSPRAFLVMLGAQQASQP